MFHEYMCLNPANDEVLCLLHIIHFLFFIVTEFHLQCDDNAYCFTDQNAMQCHFACGHKTNELACVSLDPNKQICAYM